MSYLTYGSLNLLEETSFIAGNTFYLDYSVYDESGVPIDLSGTTWTWRLSPYGETDYTVITKTQPTGITSPTAYINRVTLSSSDTISLYGKYIQQVTIISGGVTYKPAQGVITISPAIQ